MGTNPWKRHALYLKYSDEIADNPRSFFSLPQATVSRLLTKMWLKSLFFQDFLLAALTLFRPPRLDSYAA